MTVLIPKRASASRQGGEWNDDDYDVLDDGVVIGRIYRRAGAPEDPADPKTVAATRGRPDARRQGR
jgi:hypothetical protein